MIALVVYLGDTCDHHAHLLRPIVHSGPARLDGDAKAPIRLKRPTDLDLRPRTGLVCSYSRPRGISKRDLTEVHGPKSHGDGRLLHMLLLSLPRHAMWVTRALDMHITVVVMTMCCSRELVCLCKGRWRSALTPIEQRWTDGI